MRQRAVAQDAIDPARARPLAATALVGLALLGAAVFVVELAALRAVAQVT